jgi:putative flippase GtrA
LTGEILRYLLAGGLTTLVNLVTYGFLVALGAHYLLATSVAFLVAVFFAYLVNKGFVFRKGRSVEKREVLKFYGFRLLSFGIETAGLALLIEGIAFDAYLSKGFMAIVVVILNYLWSKWWIF